ncbi:hypothetical protein LTR78_010010 [Recurvomyces mirabilis]|uniref:DUF1772-domain-containing protein n=1 Tax=Recurvomyces mirabilis TaxID=574656 RepID=A0AAE0TNH4_9PEZI|nr:hypothetical protein LTR78_010010 [Recurvomyces mirabilis]KAK5149791.1 hypothetical protein LTS14_010612 [Recurvomyces mirabilis]
MSTAHLRIPYGQPAHGQTAGTFPSMFLGAYNSTFSQNVKPHLYGNSPAVLTPLYEKIYHRGASTIAPIAAIAIASNAYLAYQSRDEKKRRMYGTAAVLVFTTLSLTAFAMEGGIDRLITISTDHDLQSKAGIDIEVVRLLKTWAAQNYFQASLHLTGGLLGLYTTLS